MRTDLASVELIVHGLAQGLAPAQESGGLAFWNSLWSAIFVQGAGVIIFLAGLAEGLGTQSIVLFVNRITPLRFVLNLLLSAALYVVSALAWIAMIWLAASYVFRVPVPLSQVISAVSVAYVPLLLSALVLIPYLGRLIGALLHLWSLLFAIAAIQLTFSFSLWQSLACAALGWLLLEAARFVLGRPTERLDRWLWTLTTGRPTRLAVTDLPPVLREYVPDTGTREEP